MVKKTFSEKVEENVPNLDNEPGGEYSLGNVCLYVWYMADNN